MQIIGVWYDKLDDLARSRKPWGTFGAFHGHLEFTDTRIFGGAFVGEIEDHLGRASITGMLTPSAVGRKELVFTKRYSTSDPRRPCLTTRAISYKLASDGWGFYGTYEFLGEDIRGGWGNVVCVLVP